MMQLTEYVDLAYELLLFFFVHSPVVELFPDENAAIGLSPDLADYAEGALADVCDLLVILHVFI